MASLPKETYNLRLKNYVHVHTLIIKCYIKVHNLPAPDQKGHRGKMIWTSTILAWNRLPIEIKEEEKFAQAKKLIKRFTSL